MENINTTTGQTKTLQVPNYSGVNIQIFNPSVAAPGAAVPASNVNSTTNYSTNPCYPANYYTQNMGQPSLQPAAVKAVEEVKDSQSTGTEVREVVELTDDYIRTLESYLNSSDRDIRLMAAKEVLDRLHEDESRKNDEALTALINKMLQDPYQAVKFVAMAALEARSVNGNQKTVTLLKQIQNNDTNYGEDSLKASNILLKMSSNTLKKEFPTNRKKG